MALTENEKMELDVKILAQLEALRGMERFCIRDVNRLVNRNYNPNSIYASIMRCAKSTGYNLCSKSEWGDNYKYYVLTRPIMRITTNEIKKEKNLLYLFNDITQAWEVVYDFITNEFTIPNFTKTPDIEYSWGAGYLKDLLSQSFYDKRTFKDYEWIFNYTTDAEDIYRTLCNDREGDYITCPKDFISYLNSTEQNFNYWILKEYVERSKYGTFCYNLKETADIGKNYLTFIKDNNLDKEFGKMLATTVKSGYWYSDHMLRNFIQKWKGFYEKTNELFHLDTNKDIFSNEKLLQNAIDREKNEHLATQLQKLNYINGLQNDAYIVVVPQTQEDKQKEGSQQNNCVGYYYDDNILCGADFIFFIRKKSNPQHSYITCRYNVRDHRVAEYRCVNNSDVRDNKAIDFLKEVADAIRQGAEVLTPLNN